MKILDSDFRKELYKNLVEAGYDKTEAQKIVGAKYFDALKEDLKAQLQLSATQVASGDFDVKVDEISSKLGELNKLKEILS